ncbi:phosphotransferase [Litorivita sp. NS0012-18]|uniref:aminoglycoside phosphotransferase family protein n=1 Tax=Litorivita sp. NS0012-18 TaxID=3127655 RepID=UPI00310A53A9
MTDRASQADAFLVRNGWGGGARAPLAGDASNRKYERLKHADGRIAVLMDAPTALGEDVRPFVLIARHLSGLGLSAPQIYAEDAANGFLLLEDLGDALFARVMAQDGAMERPLYEAATDALLHLHKSPPPEGLAPYSPRVMTQMAALAYTFYLGGSTEMSAQEAAQRATAFADRFEPLLQSGAAEASVLIQRDYHAENVLWLPERDGVAKVGLLDFQDALAGHPAYDLVSMLQDARRDVPDLIERQMIARYVATSGREAAGFEAAYHLLGTQRNLRILGVFGRLCMRDGKAHYIDFIPRVWGYLMRDLDHPALAPVAEMLRRDLPAPTDEILQRLKDKCATLPKP